MSLLKITVTEKGVRGIKGREIQHIGKAAIKDALVHWWRVYLPIHFTQRGATKYGYKPRSGNPGSGRKYQGSYAWSKVEQRMNGQGVMAIGENKPFVWSGDSRRRRTSSRKIRLTSPNSRTYEGRVINTARTLNRVKNSYRDMTATTPDEDVQLDHTFQNRYERMLRARGKTAGKRIKRYRSKKG